MKFKKTTKSLGLIAASVGLGNGICAAQSSSDQPRALEEVVVTAQRKEQSLQDVPIAVNTIGGEALAKAGVDGLTSLSNAVPGLEATMVGPVVTPFLRGVGSNAANPNNEPSVAIYVDGIYQAAPFANVFSFNNIERIEVLKGPQGTLFGRNATGGVIQIVTKNPEFETSGKLSAGIANYQTWVTSGYVTTGLTDNLAADLAVQTSQQDKGWGRNVNTGREIYETDESSARSKLLFDNGGKTTALLALDYFEKDTSVGDYQLPQGVVGLDGNTHYYGRHNTDTNNDYLLSVESTGASVKLEHAFDYADFVSMTSYRSSEGLYGGNGGYDSDATPTDFITVALNMEVETLTQEFQLLGATPSFDWSMGLYFFDNSAEYAPGTLSGLGIGADPLNIFGKQNTESWSAYGQATKELVTDLRLTLGLRYTEEEQTLESAVNTTSFPETENEFQDWTWRMALEYQLTDDAMGYISYNRGLKSGGFDILTAADDGFDPEVLDAYEIGLKSEFLDRRVRLNSAIFFYDYKDIQVSSIEQNTTNTENAAGAEIKGMDLDLAVLATDRLTLNFGIALLDGEYTDYPNPVVYPESPTDPAVTLANAEGNATVRTPDVSGKVGATYWIPTAVGEFTLAANVAFNSGYYWAPDERYEQEDYMVINSTASWVSVDQKYSVDLWVKNLADEEYLLQGVPSAYGDLAVYAAPRTFGVTFGVNF